MIHLNQDGDLVLMILSLLIQKQTDPNTEIVKTKAWKQLTKFLTSCRNKKFDYTVYIYSC